MKALVYKVTKSAPPNHWTTPIHVDQPRGLAYETDTHFLHLFGRDQGVWVISPGLTISEKKSGSLRDWVERTFGAVEITECVQAVGDTVRGVWRPGLLSENELLQGLGNSEIERRIGEQAIRILVQKLDDILLYMEPSSHSLQSYGHKSRELLILACTEVENCWRSHLDLAGAKALNGRGFTTSDYVRLRDVLYLSEFSISLPLYSILNARRPFDGWDPAKPTQSLAWYDAYNKTKHDRQIHFADATLDHCISAVIAALILFCVRFGPFAVLQSLSPLATLSHQLFSIKLENCDASSFYAPKIALPHNQLSHLVCFGSEHLIQPRTVLPLQLP